MRYCISDTCLQLQSCKPLGQPGPNGLRRARGVAVRSHVTSRIQKYEVTLLQRKIETSTKIDNDKKTGGLQPSQHPC